MRDNVEDLSACFEQGAEARLKGRSRSDNPYPAGSDQRIEWEQGFLAKCDLDEERDPASDRAQEEGEEEGSRVG